MESHPAPVARLRRRGRNRQLHRGARSSCTSRSRRSACWCVSSNARWACSCSTATRAACSCPRRRREFLPSVHRLLGDLTGAVARRTDLRDKKKGAAAACSAAAHGLHADAARDRALPRGGTPTWMCAWPTRCPSTCCAGVTAGDVELAVGQDVAVDGAIERRTLFARPPLADLPARPRLCQAPQGAHGMSSALHLHRPHARLSPARAARAGPGRARLMRCARAPRRCRT